MWKKKNEEPHKQNLSFKINIELLQTIVKEGIQSKTEIRKIIQ